MLSKHYQIDYDKDSDFINEAFGLPNGYKREIFELPEFEFDNILYITGESGSGKSTLMRELYEESKVDFDKTIPIHKVVSENNEDSLRWLSYVGLGDATLYSLNYTQLSDSQKHRLKLLMIFLKEDFIVIDEFLSTLDRKTAKSVAYMFQKIVRKGNKKAVLVTAHDDLEHHLMPDTVITGKSFPSRFETSTKEYEHPYKDLTFRYGNKREYRESRLAELHYRGKYTGGAKEYLFAYIGEEQVGVLLSTNRIGQIGRKISRVVIHPSYRGCGFGKKLVERYITDYPLTEVIAVMAKYNPFFEKAGMIRVKDSVVKSPPKLKTALRRGTSFDTKRWNEKEYCMQFCTDKSNREVLSDFASYAYKLVQPGGRKLDEEQIREYILEDEKTAGRVLYQLRDKRYAKYKTRELLHSETAKKETQKVDRKK